MNDNIQKFGREHVRTITLQLVVVVVDSWNFGLNIVLVILQNRVQLPITLRPLRTRMPLTSSSSLLPLSRGANKFH